MELPTRHVVFEHNNLKLMCKTCDILVWSRHETCGDGHTWSTPHRSAVVTIPPSHHTRSPHHPPIKCVLRPCIPPTSFALCLNVTIDTDTDQPDSVNGVHTGDIYSGKRDVWINRAGHWERWLLSDVMKLDIFGEEFYVSPCAAQGIQLVASIADHEPQVIAARRVLGLGGSDDLLGALNSRLKQAIFSTPRIEKVGCIAGLCSSIPPFFIRCRLHRR